MPSLDEIFNLKRVTLHKWKKPFDPILNKNSVDEHSLPENRPSFADNDTSGQPMPSSDENLWAWNLAKKKRTERIEVEYPVENPGGSDYEKSNDFEEKSDALSNEEQQKSEKKIIKKIRSDNEKKKILKKFLAKKERLANEFGSTPKSKLEEIARELGTCFRTIRNWRFKFGMGYKNSKCQSERDYQRENIFKKFDKMKEKRIGKNKFAKRAEIEEEIARELGLSKQTINTWKVKLGQKTFKHYSREEKVLVGQQYGDGNKSLEYQNCFVLPNQND
uniref:Homeobox domain-containing protein n=1 Tax=Globodera rostochiensis TaxID=31243 RepID=A0A914HTL8_GLORO